MMFPTDDQSPFSDQGDFRSQVVEYIKEHFADVLGSDVNLLDRPDGLDVVQARYFPHMAGSRALANAA